METPTSLRLYLYVGKDENNLARKSWKQATDSDSMKAGMERGVINPRHYGISCKAGRTSEQGQQGIHAAPPGAQFSQLSLSP